MYPKYALLSRNIRCGLTDEEHFGIILSCDTNGNVQKIGEDNDYPFSLRSCMKPMQLAAISEIIEAYNLNEQEIAVISASHVGEKIHTDSVLSILKKCRLTERDLLCPVQEPLSAEAKNDLIKKNVKPKAIHNNCSGKHAAILAFCKLKGFDTKNYNNTEHPVQKLILNFTANICDIPVEKCQITTDGCTLPVLAMPLENFAKGFLNLFTNQKYQKIKTSIINNPYCYGGKKRLDSELVAASKGRIIAKVGAGNILCSVDLKKNISYVFKITDGDNYARGLIAVDFLYKKGLFSQAEKQRLDEIFCPFLSDETGKILGKTEFCYSL